MHFIDENRRLLVVPEVKLVGNSYFSHCQSVIKLIGSGCCKVKIGNQLVHPAYWWCLAAPATHKDTFY
jgi:hypothetical protein